MDRLGARHAPEHAGATASAARDDAPADRRDPRRARLKRHVLNLGLWTAQGWLAMFFIAAGWAKVTQPIPLLEQMLGWPGDLAGAFVRLFGVCEALLGLAVAAPLISWRLRAVMLTATRTLLTFACVAAAWHGLRGPIWFSGLNAAVAGLCLLVLVGRADPRAD